jgi:hypothetical protein
VNLILYLRQMEIAEKKENQEAVTKTGIFDIDIQFTKPVPGVEPSHQVALERR